MSQTKIERTFPPKDRLFARSLFAQLQSRVTKQPLERILDPRNSVSREILARANATIGTTTGAGWAAEIAQESFISFLGSLSPYSGAARLIAQALPATLGPMAAAKYPVRANAPAVPQWVAEGEPIPVTSSDFDLVTIGPLKKIASIVLWSHELSKRSDADTIFEQMFREDAAAGLDAAFFATTPGSTAANAGLLNGVTPTTNTADLEDDLAALAAAVATGGSGSVTFVMAPQRLARLRIMAPTLMANLDAVASAAVPADRVIAADGPSLFVSVGSELDIEIGTQGIVHMSDVPLEIVSDTGPTVADPVRSLWQTATVSLRLIYDLAFAKRRSTAVAYIDGVTW